MPAARDPVAKNKPSGKTVSKRKKAFKQRKIPGALAGIPFHHYGVPVADINNDNDDDDVTVTMMQTTISPSVTPRSNAPLSLQATTESTQIFVPSRSHDHIVHSQIPVSVPIPKYPDNATHVTTHPNLQTTGFPQFFHQNDELQDDLHFYNGIHDALPTASNAWQLDLRYATNHRHEVNELVFPPRSNVGLGLDADLSPNIQHLSYATNAPTLAYGSPADPDTDHGYEAAGSYVTMMSNGGPFFSLEPFNDAHARYNPYQSYL